MTWYTRNSGSNWTPTEIAEVRCLAAVNTPTRVIAFKLGRSEEAIYTMAARHGISLVPSNQSPYNRRS